MSSELDVLLLFHGAAAVFVTRVSTPFVCSTPRAAEEPILTLLHFELFPVDLFAAQLRTELVGRHC